LTPARFVTTDFFAGPDDANESNAWSRSTGDAFAGALNDATENDTSML
jgi:hypothetical protein